MRSLPCLDSPPLSLLLVLCVWGLLRMCHNIMPPRPTVQNSMELFPGHLDLFIRINVMQYEVEMLQ